MSEVKLTVDMNKIVLSSESKCYKTSLFVSDSEIILFIDRILLKIWETLARNINLLNSVSSDEYLINCLGAKIYCKLGKNCNNELQPNDIIFIKITDENNKKILNESYFYKKVIEVNQFDINISKSDILLKNISFDKLYCIFDSDFMNFPLLNVQQQQIISTENKNVIVQGVAGSGKTNICVAKIIFSACKEYRGKILYTTYSKSLLNDVKEKIEIFKFNLKSFLNNFKNNSLIFLDYNHKKAIENRLNIYFSSEDDENIQHKIEKIILFLENNVDFMLIEDLYKININFKINIANEITFTNEYLKNIKNHLITNKFDKLKNFSNEVIYKEIYGLIFGSCSEDESELISLQEYQNKRIGSFNLTECECIYAVAKDYFEFLLENNLSDNNLLSREIIKENHKINIYSLAIIDEVQDFTEINLKMFKSISRKMFCVGDALQMVNPSFFSFSFLKNLLYEQNISAVAKLKNNYRNTKILQDVIENLNEINVKLFGKHNFVVDGTSVESNLKSLCIKSNEKNFIKELKNKNYSGLTIITANESDKNNLKNILPDFEILTVSEIKGLERENVILYNILSSNQEKWQLISNKKLNRKIANENSVYRYYFNLFYVALSRAKLNVIVVEEHDNLIFSSFFNKNFENLPSKSIFNIIEENVPVFEVNEKELKSRINEFLQHAQFDNAKFLIYKLSDKTDQIAQLQKVDIYENYVFKGENQQAGIMLWKIGFYEEAKKQFMISNNSELVELVDACIGNGGKLTMNILPYYVKFKDNQMVIDVIQQVIFEDFSKIDNKQKEINKKFSEVR